jgi:hypothetical protein
MEFNTIRENLLRGGVAPRHVRRYLAELDDHLADLTARETDAGVRVSYVRDNGRRACPEAPIAATPTAQNPAGHPCHGGGYI